MVYRVDKEIIQTPTDVGLEFENVFILTSDGNKIHGWYIQAAHPTRKTILFCHGNAGNISGRLETIALFHNLGVNIMVFDYQGYGRSTGEPSEHHTYEDALAMWNYLTHELKIPPDKLVVMGRSLGGGVAAWLASQKEVAGLILEATFTSFKDVAKQTYPFLPVSMLLQFQYPVEKFVQYLNAPVLIAHSSDDELIPFEMGQRLFSKSPEPKSFLELKGPHSGAFLETGQPYIQAIKQFIEEVTTNENGLE